MIITFIAKHIFYTRRGIHTLQSLVFGGPFAGNAGRDLRSREGQCSHDTQLATVVSLVSLVATKLLNGPQSIVHDDRLIEICPPWNVTG
jgi:hypothetical protein